MIFCSFGNIVYFYLQVQNLKGVSESDQSEYQHDRAEQSNLSGKVKASKEISKGSRQSTSSKKADSWKETEQGKTDSEKQISVNSKNKQGANEAAGVRTEKAVKSVAKDKDETSKSDKGKQEKLKQALVWSLFYLGDFGCWYHFLSKDRVSKGYSYLCTHLFLPVLCILFFYFICGFCQSTSFFLIKGWRIKCYQVHYKS